MDTHYSNADAIAALASDDPNQFRPLIEHYQRPLFGFLGRMGFSQADAEDLAQEILLKVWRYRGTYDPDKAQVSTWLFTIARNTAISGIEKAAREHHTGSDAEVEENPKNQPEQILYQQQKNAALTQALRQLPLNDRCVIALFYIDALSTAQAAAVMHCTNSAFKTRLSRSRDKLKAILINTDAFND